jgi:seryl-tRNA synthetase
MGIQQTYDLQDLDSTLFGQVKDTITFSRDGTARVVAEDDRRLTVEFGDADVLRYIDGFVSDAKAMQRRLRQKVLYEIEATSAPRLDVDEALANSPDVYALGDGLIGLRGRLLRLFRFFEAEFLSLARLYAADENEYPALVPIELLEELGYFSHFPQQVTFCSHFPEDLPFLEAMVTGAKAAGGGLPAEYRAKLGTAAHVLTPAVCLPCYRQHRDTVVPDDGLVVTMQNHVYRYEGSNFRSLGRLWDFTVRDLVFFGTGQAVAQRRAKVMEQAFALCRELGLAAKIQLANDPFFLNESRNKRVYQRMGEVKYELVLPLRQREEELAVSSFNLHRDFYARLFDIRLAGGGHAESACMGFGIERWVYGFLCQKGLDPADWPQRVAARVAG